VKLAGVRVPADALLGVPGQGWRPLRRVLERATVALCAEMCGGAQRVLEMTTEYAKIRVAFGKPIGAYQGVKHKAADMLVEVENAKSITYYAAWAVDENAPDATLAVSMAKAYVSDAYRRVAGAEIPLLVNRLTTLKSEMDRSLYDLRRWSRDLALRLGRREDEGDRTRSLATLGDTVGGLAHNFNNSLGAILGYTELLLREAQDDT